MRVCLFSGCGKRHHAKGLCRGHYRQARRGDQLSSLAPQAPPAPLKDRLERLSREEGGCRLWVGHIGRRGYGEVKVNGKKMNAHRAAYIDAYGQIPDGMFVDHTCDNRHCVSLEHLRLATNKQNQENRRAKPRSVTGFRNVYIQYGKYKVIVRHNGVPHSGGVYSSLDEAKQAAIELRNKLFTHNDLDRQGQ